MVTPQPATPTTDPEVCGALTPTKLPPGYPPKTTACPYPVGHEWVHDDGLEERAAVRRTPE